MACGKSVTFDNLILEGQPKNITTSTATSESDGLSGTDGGHALLRGIYAYGYENPTQSQVKNIPRITQGVEHVVEIQNDPLMMQEDSSINDAGSSHEEEAGSSGANSFPQYGVQTAVGKDDEKGRSSATAIAILHRLDQFMIAKLQPLEGCLPIITSSSQKRSSKKKHVPDAVADQDEHPSPSSSSLPILQRQVKRVRFHQVKALVICYSDTEALQFEDRITKLACYETFRGPHFGIYRHLKPQQQSSGESGAQEDGDGDEGSEEIKNRERGSSSCSEDHVGDNCHILITSLESCGVWGDELIPWLQQREEQAGGVGNLSLCSNLQMVVFDGVEHWQSTCPFSGNNTMKPLNSLLRAIPASGVQRVCLASYMPSHPVLQEHLIPFVGESIQDSEEEEEEGAAGVQRQDAVQKLMEKIVRRGTSSEVLDLPAEARAKKKSEQERNSLQTLSHLPNIMQLQRRDSHRKLKPGPLKNFDCLLDWDEQHQLLLQDVKEEDESVRKRRSLALQSALRGIYSYGFEQPSPVQSEMIPHIAHGRHCVINQWPQGSGKTSGLCCGLISRISNTIPLEEVDYRGPIAIVLCPTRETARATTAMLNHLGDYLPHWSAATNPNFKLPGKVAHAFIGGTRVQDDIAALDGEGRQYGGVLIAVGCIGRIMDLIKRGALKTHFVRTVALDDAEDCLNSPGSQEQVSQLFGSLPSTTQMVFVSGFLHKGFPFVTQYVPRLEEEGSDDGDDGSKKVKKEKRRDKRTPSTTASSKKVPRSAAIVQSGSVDLRPSPLPDNFKVFRVDLEEEDKFETICDLYESISIAQSLIMCYSTRKVEWLAEKMNGANCTVSYLHSDMPQGEREKVMQTFLSGSARVLVCTPEMVRGVNFHHVNIELFYDVFPTTSSSSSSSSSSTLTTTTTFSEFVRDGCHTNSGFRKSGHVTIYLTTRSDMDPLMDFSQDAEMAIPELPMDFASCLGA